MMSRGAWFVVGLILIALLASYAPKWGGAFAILILLVLGFNAAKQHLV